MTDISVEHIFFLFGIVYFATEIIDTIWYWTNGE